MAQPSDAIRKCRVLNAEKLSAGIGGEQDICAALKRAAAAEAPGIAYSADIRILSPTVISATVTLGDGRVLPEQKMAISDSPMRKSAIDRFARSLAVRIAQAS